MFRIIMKTHRYFHIHFNEDYRIVPVAVFNRAKTQKDRRIRIRKPVTVLIDYRIFIFKSNQWKKAKSLGSDYKRFCAGLPHLYKWESKGRFKKNKKRCVPIKSFQ